jgi:hypothetical protein
MDIYRAYAADLLLKNPTWWGKYDYAIRTYKNFYIYRKLDNGSIEEVINYRRFKQILEVYLKEAKNQIIQGGQFSLGSYTGFIAARRVERNFANPKVNWAETAKQPKDENGKATKLIFFMDEDWCRIAWNKVGRAAAYAHYKFVPTGGAPGVGFKTDFIAALKHNVHLKYKYPYFPFVVDANDI